MFSLEIVQILIVYIVVHTGIIVVQKTKDTTKYEKIVIGVFVFVLASFLIGLLSVSTLD